MEKRNRFIRTLNKDEQEKLRAEAKARGLSQRSSSLPKLELLSSGELLVSDAQKSLWFLSRLNPNSSAYHISTALQLQGELQITALQRSLNQLFARHQSLRSTFVSPQGQVQLALLPEEHGISLTQHDLRDQGEETCQTLIRTLIECPFELGQQSLIRADLLQIDEHEWLLVLVQHHMITDGWSIGQQLSELFHDYRYFLGKESHLTPAPALQYNDYVAWQRQQRRTSEWKIHQDYWRETLTGVPALLTLPYDRPRPQQQSHEGDYVNFSLSSDLVGRLKAFSQQRQATLFMSLLAGWGGFLSRLADQRDLVIGLPSANRQDDALQHSVGYFANTLALRVELDEDITAEQLLTHVKSRLLDAQKHQALPFEHVIDALNPVRSLSYTPVFQTLINWQSLAAEDLSSEQLSVSNISCQLPVQQIKFDLELQLQETAEGISAQLGFANALFDRETIERYSGYYCRLLEAMVNAPDLAVARLPLLADTEQQQLLHAFNDTEQPYPQESCIHQLFERQVLSTPDLPAVRFDEKTLNYRQLNQQANQLAQSLIEKGVGPEMVVALCAERGIALVVAILAIAKAGGAYLPLDPDYPVERLALMLDDARPTLLLADQIGSHILSDVLPTGLSVLNLSNLPLDAQHVDNPVVDGLSPDNLAYLIYTSGSTGRPKGVLNQHGALVNRIYWMQQAYGLNEQDVVLQKTPFSFDVSVWEFFWPLITGACLQVARPGGHKDTGYLVELIKSAQISTLHFVPSMLGLFLTHPQIAECQSIKRIICSGEALSAAHVKLCQQLLPAAEIYNLYGPTEAAIDVTAWRCPTNFADDQVPIGKPIANTQLYILDRYLAPVPLGAAGELYIGGGGVARGYLNRPELTAERFIQSPFSDAQNARLYRTGDVARYQRDGTLLYLGRNDHQVKLRGFRIELGEIEAHLEALPEIKAARVLMREDRPGDQRIVAYVVPENAGSTPDIATLRQILTAKLPEYMVPSAFVTLTAFPLTSNGKLDRNALPEPQSSAYSHEGEEAPVGKLEIQIAEIWSSLLGIDDISRHDNFFALGGHSLLAIQVIEELRQQDILADINHLFNSPSLCEFAATLGGDVIETQSVEEPVKESVVGIALDATVISPDMLPLIELNQQAIDQICQSVDGGVANIQDIYALSPLQDGMVFHHLLEGDGDPYLQVNQLAFTDKSLLNRFIQALQQVVNRHDILRTAIASQVTPAAQVVWRKAELQIQEIQLDAQDGPISEQLRQRFNPRKMRMALDQPPLLKLVIAQDEPNNRWILLQLIHHLIGDHYTLEQILHEVALIMAGRAQELKPAIPYRQLIERLTLTDRSEQQRRYFQQQLADIDEPSLAYGQNNIMGSGSDVEDSYYPLPAELNQRLRTQARRMGVSLASLCHLAWGRVLAATSSVEKTVFGTVLFGRMAIQPQNGSALGLFINTLPLRVDIDQRGIEQAAKDTHQSLLTLLQYENTPLVLAQQCSGVAAPTPLFNTLLNYRHNTSGMDNLQDSGLLAGIQPLDEKERTNYPIVVAVEDTGESLALTVQARKPIVAQDLCLYMSHVLHAVADALEHQPEQALHTLPVLPLERQQQLLQNSEVASLALGEHGNIVELFEAQEKRAPQAIALKSGPESLSYQQLNQRANQLAHHLIAQGARPGKIVALCTARGIPMVIGLLAILKSGSAYLPLDADYPSERLAYILNDAEPLLLIADRQGDNALGAQAPQVGRINLDEVWQSGALTEGHNPVVSLAAQNLAYLIYTSGSTGKPKGVCVSHDNLLNHTLWQHQAFALSADDYFIQRTSISFDASVWELWTPLALGAPLYIVPGEIMRDLPALVDLIVHERISVLQVVPSLLSGLENLEALSDGALRYIFCGGEPLSGALVNRLLPLVKEAVVNLYGPTETTIDATFNLLRQPVADNNTVAIGCTIANTRIYLLDSQQQLVPEGAVGEIYIAGRGVTQGYHQHSALTAERFFIDKFADRDSGERMYRSGDLARRQADGNLQFIGRVDQQVKVRGYRIEPGEIEHHLADLPGVHEAVVTLYEDTAGQSQLVAYIRPIANQTLEGGELRAELHQRLPRHMIPSLFVTVPEWPRLPNGKLNRAALPKPQDALLSSRYEAPQNPSEVALAGIWCSLLNLSEVGRQDDFFALGGHSLLLVRLLNRIVEQGYPAPALNDFFQNPLLADMARLIDSTPTQASSYTPIPLLPTNHAAPLSYFQQRMWFIQQLEPDNPALNIPGVLRLRGDLNVEALQQSLNRLFARHSVLRTAFVLQDGQPVTSLLPVDAGITLVQTDLRRSEDVEQAVANLTQQVLRQPFDLTQGLLWRAHLVCVAEQHWQLLLVLHHSISDAWSTQILLQELEAFYNAELNHRTPELAALTVQYGDYAAWQRSQLEEEETSQKLEKYWLEQLVDLPPVMALAESLPRPERLSGRAGSVPVTLPPELTKALRALSQRQGGTLFMTLLGTWALLLSRLSNQQDLIVGIHSANRTHPQTEALVGPLINSLALRFSLSDELNVSQWLDETRRILLNAQMHQELPFERVVEVVNPTRSMNHTPLFQVAFNWHAQGTATPAFAGVEVQNITLTLPTTKYDLTLQLQDHGAQIEGSLDFNADLFTTETIERYRGYLLLLLEQMHTDAQHPVSQLNLLSVSEQQALLRQGTGPIEPIDERGLHQLFEAQAKLTPETLAVVAEDQTLSYRQLNECANQLAHHLASLGVTAGDAVAICVGRNSWMPVAILAVLKAGAAYVPLDPVYASERLQGIIDDAQPKLVLGDSEGLQAIGHFPANAQVLLASDREWLANPTTALSLSGKPFSSLSLAYILYTSGSTGRPKGVMVKHCSAVNFWQALRGGIYQPLPAGSRIALNASFSFDMSLKGLTQLLSGHTLVLIQQTTRTSGKALLKFLREQKIDGLDTTPSQLSLLIDAGLLEQPLPRTLRLLIGGEAISPKLWQQLYSCSHLECINMYGPTEATVDVTIGPITRENRQAHIGVPIRNARVYMLDKYRRCVPQGSEGELYLAGAGVANGYLNQPQLTSERFIADPFSDDENAVMYRTGDLGRFLADGKLEYLGRNDSQIKLRGFRIEPGEIEARIVELPQIREAVVLVRGETAADQRLVAYFTSLHTVDDLPALRREIFQTLQTVLPAYMVPAAFVYLPEFKQTVNGKLDYRALPEPDASALVTDDFEALQTREEHILAAIWQSLFNIEAIGRKDDFFRLGGHSLLAVQMIENLRKQGWQLAIQTLFTTPTLEKLAKTLCRSETLSVPANPITVQSQHITPDMLPLIDLTAEDIDTIVAGVEGGVSNIQDIYALSPLQDGILFHHLLAKEGDPYLQRSVLGFASLHELQSYLSAFKNVVKRHDILRTAIVWQGLSQPAQVVWREITLDIREVSLSAQDGDIAEQLFELADPRRDRMSLESAPLMQFVCCEDSVNQRWLLLQRVHHLICDHGTMMQVAQEVDFIMQGQEARLTPAGAFRDLIAQTYQQENKHGHEAFFREQLADISEPTLPFGLDNVYLDGGQIQEFHLRLSAELNARLRHLSRQAGASLASLFHLAWARVIAATSGQQTVVFGTVLLGKMSINAAATDGLGMFINTLPIRVDIHDDNTLTALLKTQQSLAQLLQHEHASLALAQQCSGLPGNIPLFSSLLNYRHNQHEKTETRTGPLEMVKWVKGEERSNYPLTLSVEDYGDELGLSVQVIEPIAPQRICLMIKEALSSIADALESNSQRAIANLNVLPAQEWQQCLYDYNQTDVDYPRHLGVQQHFEQQVTLSPNAIAIIEGEQQLSYKDLNEQANRLAHYLRVNGWGTGDAIAVLCERSIIQVVAQLAISKVGACIVPLDPQALPARQRYMLQDSQVRLLLTQEPYLGEGFGTLPYALLDQLSLAEFSINNLPVSTDAEAPLYVLYTSGSTGEPKGVLIPHRAINNLITHCTYIDIESDDRLAYEVNPAFDTVLFELWGALINGAAMVVIDNETKLDPQKLAQAIAQHHITILWQTSGLFTSMVSLMADHYHSLKALMVGGDVVDPSAIQQVIKGGAPKYILNGYGPTECTTFATFYRVPTERITERPLPIGKPINNTQIYLLDTSQQPVPLGAVGEICIGGDGVSLGYLNLPEATAERFIPDPFRSGGRIYRTGDYGRWNDEGELLFLGRKDHMLKIRGFRVELGEIEAQLMKIASIQQAVVLPLTKDDREAQLVAYYTCADEHDYQPREVREALVEHLPDYMLPAAYINVPGFTITLNGKINRRDLPVPTSADFISTAYEAPHSGMEEAIAALWIELLSVKQVGRHDSFFSLGGHSLLAIRLLGRLKKTFGLTISLSTLFDNSTLAGFSEQLLLEAVAKKMATSNAN
ncbi:non-ribosomal peptide synthetase [Xenorhabdus bovienii]|uniref:non-ribosomal peptide synthetase n=1 Tax=Xenorhabdus bovienii TaxID=40576 RepID=UPI0023B23717|nr:non-ribosomal peptide synthetase [Xenorhabdus bovienii]MDE9430506.1 amino acid adenylation domain-containing protein [Xenorhabdus bovienii]